MQLTPLKVRFPWGDGTWWPPMYTVWLVVGHVGWTAVRLVLLVVILCGWWTLAQGGMAWEGGAEGYRPGVMMTIVVPGLPMTAISLLYRLRGRGQMRGCGSC